MLGVFAEFEREIIRERVGAGIARARVKGTKSGRPFGRPAVGPRKIAAVRAELAKGAGILKTARLVGVGVSVVQRVRRSETIER